MATGTLCLGMGAALRNGSDVSRALESGSPSKFQGPLQFLRLWKHVCAPQGVGFLSHSNSQGFAFAFNTSNLRMKGRSGCGFLLVSLYKQAKSGTPPPPKRKTRTRRPPRCGAPWKAWSSPRRRRRRRRGKLRRRSRGKNKRFGMRRNETSSPSKV